MKTYISIIVSMLLAVTAFSQQFRLVGNPTGFPTQINDSTYTLSVDFASDQTGNSFLPTQIDSTFRMFFQNEKIYRIDSVANATFSSADFWLVEFGDTDGQPSGQGLVYDPQGGETVPQAPANSSGASPVLNAAIATYNQLSSKIGPSNLLQQDANVGDILKWDGSIYAPSPIGSVKYMLEDINVTVCNDTCDYPSLKKALQEASFYTQSYDTLGNNFFRINIVRNGDGTPAELTERNDITGNWAHVIIDGSDDTVVVNAASSRFMASQYLAGLTIQNVKFKAGSGNISRFFEFEAANGIFLNNCDFIGLRDVVSFENGAGNKAFNCNFIDCSVAIKVFRAKANLYNIGLTRLTTGIDLNTGSFVSISGQFNADTVNFPLRIQGGIIDAYGAAGTLFTNTNSQGIVLGRGMAFINSNALTTELSQPANVQTGKGVIYDANISSNYVFDSSQDTTNVEDYELRFRDGKIGLSYNWSWDTQPVQTGVQYQDIKYNNGIWHLIARTGTGNRIQYSYDGKNYKNANYPSELSYRKIAYKNGIWVVSGFGSSKFVYSIDGINFVESNTTLANHLDIVADDSLFYTFKIDYTQYHTSTDGKDWTSYANPIDNGRPVKFYGHWYGIGSGNVYKSAGSSYSNFDTIATGLPDRGYKLIAGDGYLVAYSIQSGVVDSNIIYSQDGVTWKSVRSDISSRRWLGAAYGGGKFIFMSSDFDDATKKTAVGEISESGTLKLNFVEAFNGYYIEAAYGNGVWASASDYGDEPLITHGGQREMKPDFIPPSTSVLPGQIAFGDSDGSIKGDSSFYRNIDRGYTHLESGNNIMLLKNIPSGSQIPDVNNSAVFGDYPESGKTDTVSELGSSAVFGTSHYVAPPATLGPGTNTYFTSIFGYNNSLLDHSPKNTIIGSKLRLGGYDAFLGGHNSSLGASDTTTGARTNALMQSSSGSGFGSNFLLSFSSNVNVDRGLAFGYDMDDVTGVESAFFLSDKDLSLDSTFVFGKSYHRNYFPGSVGIGTNSPVRAMHISGPEVQFRLESIGGGGADNWLEMVNTSDAANAANIIQFYKGGGTSADRSVSIGIPKGAGDSTFVIGITNNADALEDGGRGFNFHMRNGEGTFQPEAYGKGNLTATSQGVTLSNYSAHFATNGTMVDVQRTKTGTGTPVGSLTPDFIGQTYVDTTTPGSEVVWFAVGLTNTSWKQISN